MYTVLRCALLELTQHNKTFSVCHNHVVFVSTGGRSGVPAARVPGVP